MKKYYSLFVITLAYKTNGIVRQQGLNVLAVEDSPLITRSLLGNAQQQAQIRFMSEIDPKAEIIDALIGNIIPLGHMAPEEFHEGFEVPGEKPAETSQSTPANEQPAVATPTEPTTGADESNLPASARGTTNNG